MTDAPAKQAALELTEIDLSYAVPDREPLQVLRGMDLEVARGELVCLAGRSGSGKSSLLHVAAGLLPPDAGSVKWLGREIVRAGKDDVTAWRRTTIGFVFQSGGLVEILTAAENVALPGMPAATGSTSRAETAARASQMLEQVGLRKRADHFPAQLSGGERQRVAVARALFHDPPVLIVDEPTASLDAQSAEHMVAVLRDIRDRGHAVLVASHDDHVLRGADRVVTLD
ncbi:MAG: putative transport system ATP-binding protein [Chloroflexota bacterium]|nr:putative transport system ATP-binding protein [Chloroflexota bacterium]